MASLNFIEDDQSIGNWLESIPYVDAPEGRIYHGAIPANIKKDLSTCSVDVRNYFQEVKKSTLFEESQFRLEGRKWWGLGTFQKPGKIVRGVMKTPTPLARKITLLGGIKNMDVSTLICGVGENLDQILGFSSPPSTFGCTPYGRKIAHSLIKVAATRIFANPAQSVMEPLVNSIDAYFPERRIGKFGMGFFSSLYWLVRDPSYETTAKAKKTAKTKKTKARPTKARPSKEKKPEMVIESHAPGEHYLAILKFVDGALLLDLDVVEASRVMSSGASIEIDTFASPEEVAEMIKYSFRIREVQHINQVVKLYGDNPPEHPVPPNKNNKSVCEEIVYNALTQKLKLTFEDFATGIPLKVLFDSLLIPSVSTKQITGGGIRSGKVRESRTRLSTDELSSHSTLSITVGDIIIWEGRALTTTESIDAFLSLPYETKLPVSRDDFIVDPLTRLTILEAFERVLCPAFPNLSTLEKLVDTYSAQTSSLENRDLMEEALQNFRDKMKVLVPGAFMWLYRTIDPRIIGTNHYAVLALEEWLDKQWVNPGDIWKGIKVFFYDPPKGGSDTITFAGTNTFLFIPKSFRTGSEWKTRLEASFTERVLFPIGSDEEKNKNIRGVLGASLKLERDLDMLTALLGTIKAKELWYSIVPQGAWETYVIKFAKYMMDSHYRYYYNVMSALISRLALAKPDYVYGGHKSFLSMFALHHYSSAMECKSEKEERLMIDDFLWKAKNENPFDVSLIMPSSFHRTFLKENFEDLISGSKTFLEVSLTSYVLTSKTSFSSVPEKFRPGIVRDVILDIRSHSRSFLANKAYLESFLRKVSYWRRTNTYFGELDAIVAKYKVRINSLIREDDFSGDEVFVADLPKDAISFKTSALIDSIFRIPYDGTDFYSKIKPSNPPVKLQILSIAVNEATTKTFEEAVVTETFQNSVDASRGSGNQTHTIHFTVSLVPTNPRRVIFTITDFIGMTEDQFFHIGIPFLSSKTPSELQTGEMGTGFFNVYRRSSMVQITTSKDNKYFVSQDTPIRVGDRVEDLDRKVTFGTKKSSNYTTITLMMDHPTQDSALTSLGAFKAFIEGIIMASPLKLSVVLNRVELPGFSGQLIFSTEFYEIYYSEDNQLAPLLCTKGIPLGPLDAFLKNKTDYSLYFGIIVNLKNKAYTPVHSRTKVNVPPEVKSFIPKVHFLAALRKQELNKNLLSHTKSWQDLSQTTLIGDIIEDWENISLRGYVNFPLDDREERPKKVADKQPAYPAITLVTIINGISGEYGNGIPGSEIIKELKMWGGYPKISKWINPIKNMAIRLRVINIVSIWMKGKNPSATEEAKARVKKAQEEKKGDVIVPTIIEKFFATYGAVYVSFLEKYFEIRPGLTFKTSSLEEGDPLGQYSPVFNHVDLFVNESFFPGAEKAINEFIKSKSPNQTARSLGKSDFWDMYISSGDAVVPHELEHYRRQTSHIGSHDVRTEDLFGKTILRSFPDAHVEIRSRFILDGFWEEVHTQLIK